MVGLVWKVWFGRFGLVGVVGLVWFAYTAYSAYFATLTQTPIFTSKSCETHLRTFVNQTTMSTF